MGHVNGGHHRSDNRSGPWHAFCRRKAEILLKFNAPCRLLDRMVVSARRIGVDTYVIPGGSALFLKAKVVLDEWRPLADDVDGEQFT